jgi:very-short-patch-repair endonuclease
MNSSTERRPRDPRVPQARRLRRDVTIAERKLWWHLKKLSLEVSHFRRQAAVGPFFVDFVCHKKRLIIEVDGGQHNDSPQSEADRRRSLYLQANGYRVLRFWNNEVLNEIDGVLEVIAASIAQIKRASPPTPDPSPPLASLAGGGE